MQTSPQEIDTLHFLDSAYPDIQKKFGKKNVKILLKKLFHEAEINQFINKNRHLRGFSFLDAVLEYFNFDYSVSNKQLHHIPSDGRLIIVANHPIGSLDGLALLKMVHTVRPDVRIVAHSALSLVEPLQSLFLPVKVSAGNKNTIPKSSYNAILQALENEEAIIIFPAGEVSRIRPNGVRDGKWHAGFVKLAIKSRTPVLPVHIDGRNSVLFYMLSSIYKPFGTALLIQEMFQKRNDEVTFHVSKPVAASTFTESDKSLKQLAKEFRTHMLQLARKNPKLPFATFQTIAHPVNSKLIRKELRNAQLLGTTFDDKQIYLFDNFDSSAVMQEIGRLRELTFRVVGEGTNRATDIDRFDSYYRHIILWDEQDHEIVGAYRIGEGANIYRNYDLEGFYSNSLFQLNDQIRNYLPQSIELGRSFVQPRYWGKRSLDYLWHGIGAYLQQHQEIRYLFGPVSISASYPEIAVEAIVGFYARQFGSYSDLATPRNPYVLSDVGQQYAKSFYTGDYKSCFNRLQSRLHDLGVKVPTLYKQYSELCDDKGCRFIGFNIDTEFNNCIDSLIMLDLSSVTPRMRKRYLSQNG